MESLRLYPAFPAMIRTTVNHTTSSFMPILPSTHIIVSPYAINRSKSLWGSDAHDFDPERWIRDYNGGSSSPYGFMSFSAGPRVCIGREFAIVSLKVMLATLISHFKFEQVREGWEPEFQKGTALKLKGGLKLKVMRAVEEKSDG